MHCCLCCLQVTGRLGKLLTTAYCYYIIYIGCEIYELVCMSILVFLVGYQKHQNAQADLLILGKFCSLEVVQVQSLSIQSQWVSCPERL
mgnify:CR=1 FL=1